MSAEPIHLVTDAGSPVTAFTTKDDMKSYLRRGVTRSTGRWSTESTAMGTRLSS
jgi:hypothetical protein